MPLRNNDQIRRGINRLCATIDAHAEIPSLAVIKPEVSSAAGLVNDSWNNLQMLTLQGGAERGARDILISDVGSWIQHWRPVLLIKIPSAQSSLRVLPNTGATPDEIITVALDMVGIMKKNPNLSETVNEAQTEETIILEADKKVKSANAILSQETAARQSFTNACFAANSVLVRGTEIVRAAFGRTSPEYKKFIGKTSASDNGDNTTTTGKNGNNKPLQNNGTDSNSDTGKPNTNPLPPKTENTISNGTVKNEITNSKEVESSVK